MPTPEETIIKPSLTAYSVAHAVRVAGSPMAPKNSIDLLNYILRTDEKHILTSGIAN